MAIERIGDVDQLDDRVEAVTRIKSEPICCNEKKSKKSVLFLREHSFLKRNPVQLTCPNCLRCVETIVERHNSSTTHFSALLLIPACLCAVPYFSKTLRDSIHRCPSCGIYLGAKFASANEAFVICFRQPTTHRENDTSEEAQIL